ncbi:MAG: biopolymer transporter ExbD [Planctomycetes bacterium]|nr:biopolymer transporter ExbD [Planctomycetota bacterium]
MPFKSSQSRVNVPVVEMTPMIDIVFLLIIFFMVAAQFAQQAKVELSLPEEIGEQKVPEQASMLIININIDGDIILDETKGVIALDELRLQLKSLDQGGLLWEDVTIRADRNASTKALNNVLSLLSKHGLKATKIATEIP